MAKILDFKMPKPDKRIPFIVYEMKDDKYFPYTVVLTGEILEFNTYTNEFEYITLYCEPNGKGQASRGTIGDHHGEIVSWCQLPINLQIELTKAVDTLVLEKQLTNNSSTNPSGGVIDLPGGKKLYDEYKLLLDSLIP